jgi:hypothetical protein
MQQKEHVLVLHHAHHVIQQGSALVAQMVFMSTLGNVMLVFLHVKHAPPVTIA